MRCRRATDVVIDADLPSGTVRVLIRVDGRSQRILSVREVGNEDNILLRLSDAEVRFLHQQAKMAARAHRAANG